MIDEIPERDPRTHSSSSKPLALSHIVILLVLIFGVVLAMLFGSRAFDKVAEKLWPTPAKIQTELSINNTGTKVDVSNAKMPTLSSSQSSSQASSIPFPLNTATSNTAASTVGNEVTGMKHEKKAVVNPVTVLQNQQTIQIQPSLQASVKMEVENKEIKNNKPRDMILDNNLSRSEINVEVQNAAEKTLAVPKVAVDSASPLQYQETIVAGNNDSNTVASNNNSAIGSSMTETQATATIAATPISNSTDKTLALESSLKDAAAANHALQQEKAQRQNLNLVKHQAKNKSPKDYTLAEKEILKNDPRHYTVQILGMHNKEKLKAFIAERKLQGKVKYCRGEHQGKPWFVLVYGEYATLEEAQKVIAGLPPEVKKQKPWVRSFASLQGTIHARE